MSDSKKRNQTNDRANYSVDKLHLTEVGPSSISTLIKHHIKAIPNKAIIMIGEPGIGKTVVVNDLQETGDFQVLTIRLVNEDEGTMIGYADPGQSEDTVKLRVVTRIKESVVAAKENNKQLIVFFDEVNRAKEHMIKCVFNIIDMKRWGDLELPKDTCFIAAINPPTANHKVRDILSDAALRRRFVTYAVKADVGEYIEYAKSHGIAQVVIDFLQSNPGCLYDYHSLDNGFPYACPASWDTVSDLVKWFASENGDSIARIEDNVTIQRILIGSIGSSMAFEFLDFVKESCKTFAPQDIINDYKSVRPRVKAAINSEFKEEDSHTLNTSQLSRAARTLGIYVVHQLVSEGMQLHCTKEQAAERKWDTKKMVKTNLQGKNLATFLSDCPSTVLQTFYAALNEEMSNIVKNSGESTEYMHVLSQLVNYPEYIETVNRFNTVVSDLSTDSGS